jgi:hypothetical protein
MLRRIAAIAAGLLSWTFLVTLGNLLLRWAWPAYALAEPAMTFTLPMLLARLAMSAAASLVSSWIAAIVGGRRSGVITGFILLAAFLPVHHALWAKFPVWYHLIFLTSLPLLAFAGAALVRPGAKASSS